MGVLNYFYFLIFLFLCLNGIRKPYTKLTYRDKGEKKEFEVARGGYLIYFLIITSLFAFYAAGAIDLAAIRLMLTMGIFVLMLTFFGRGVRFTFPIFIYILFLLWVALGSAFSEFSSGYALRAILKYAYPLLLFFVCSTFVTDERLVLKISQDLRKVALFSLCVYFIPYVIYLFDGVFYYSTALSLHYMSISAISLAAFMLFGRKKKDVLFAILFVLPCIIWVYRTSLLANVAMFSMFAIFRYKIRAVIPLAIIVMLGVVSVFYVPAVRNKMFGSGSNVTIQDLQNGDVTMDQVNSNGRFAMWEDLTDRFYVDNEIMGSGTGTIQGYMYTNHVFGGLKAAHNDYVVICCDNGIVGVVLYLLAFVSIIISCFVEFNKRQNSDAVKYCAVISANSLAAIMVSMYTENTVNYSVAALTCPIAFYGMMIGLKNSKNT